MNGLGVVTAKAIAAALVAAGLLLAGCTEPEDEFPPRTRVGLMPEEFAARPVSSPADAAGYVDEYAEALGVEGVRAERVLKVESSYWVYVTETDSQQEAFALEVFSDGEIRLRRFPAMEPEMMWNQKYGHRARPDPDTMQEPISRSEAERRLRRVLPEDPALTIRSAYDYYGYFLFPLCDGEEFVGEGAVNADDGEAVWERLPTAVQETWSAAGGDGVPCD